LYSHKADTLVNFLVIFVNTLLNNIIKPTAFISSTITMHRGIPLCWNWMNDHSMTTVATLLVHILLYMLTLLLVIIMSSLYWVLMFQSLFKHILTHLAFITILWKIYYYSYHNNTFRICRGWFQMPCRYQNL
jgi:hypothetical protein